MANMNSKTSEYSLALTVEEMKELETAREMPITVDDDCPETTPERAIKFRRVNPPKISVS